jgi:hypothetical protein
LAKTARWTSQPPSDDSGWGSMPRKLGAAFGTHSVHAEGGCFCPWRLQRHTSVFPADGCTACARRPPALRYNFTDVPSFVSGQHLVMFDPHSRFLPGTSPAQPGLRLNLAQGRLSRHFPDAFRPYQHFGCTMEVSVCGACRW